MRILFLTRLYWPHVGGVEKHAAAVGRELVKRGHAVTILTEKYTEKLRNEEMFEGVKIIRFSYPQIKFLGLLAIWFRLWQNRSLIKQSDIVHCHDVFIWYLPFLFLYSKKPVYTTFHGWEGKYPVPRWNIWQKRLAAKLSWGNICVGKYIEKWYGIKANYVTYGGVDLRSKISDLRKIRNSIAYLGRLEQDTGLPKFLKWLMVNDQRQSVDFLGDGSLRKECEKYGKVKGFVNPEPYLRKAEYCVPGGYLAYLEARAFGCKIMTFYNNPLKKDYWQEISKAWPAAPVKKLRRISSWKEVAKIYENLYRYHRS